MIRLISCTSWLLFAGIAYGVPCPQGEWCQWTIAEGGNDHWYRSTGQPKLWAEAEADAIIAGGHLVTINDAAENTWLFDKFPYDDSVAPPINHWIGFFQDTTDSNFSEPSAGWKWVGEPNLCGWNTGNPTVCYTSWRSSEPNDGNPSVSENYAELHWGPGAGWNDRVGDTTLLWHGLIERTTFPAVPAVSEWGLIVMLLLIVTAGTTVFKS